MATPTSKEDFLRHYRCAFDDNQRGIEEILRKKVCYHLLRLYHAINEEEEERIEKQTPWRERPTAAFRIVRGKDTLECYVGCSRVLMDINRAASTEVFPFVRHLRDGHAPLPKRNMPEGKQIHI